MRARFRRLVFASLTFMLASFGHGAWANALIKYPSFSDLIAGTNSVGGFISPPNFIPGISVVGIAFDGSRYILLAERDVDIPGFPRYFLNSYASLNDLISDNAISGAGFGLNFIPGISVIGLAYDGSNYLLLAQRDVDTPPFPRYFLRAYSTLSDLIGDNETFGSGFNLNFVPGVSVRGLAYDGSYLVLAERDTDLAGFPNLFVDRYATVADIANNQPLSGAGFSRLAPTEDVYGFDYDGSGYYLYTETRAVTPGPGPNPGVVGEPAPLLLLIVPLIGISITRAFRSRRPPQHAGN